jgi:hypothetical protein
MSFPVVFADWAAAAAGRVAVAHSVPIRIANEVFMVTSGMCSPWGAATSTQSQDHPTRSQISCAVRPQRMGIVQHVPCHKNSGLKRHANPGNERDGHAT